MKYNLVTFLIPFTLLPTAIVAQEIRLNCQMGACFWVDVVEKSEAQITPEEIKTVKAKLKYFTTRHDGDYPNYFDSSIPLEDVRETEATAICNREYPAILGDDGTFTSLGLLEAFGYEISAASLYMLLCHDLQYSSLASEDLNALGYISDNRVSFASVAELQSLLSTERVEGQTSFHFQVIDVASNDVLNIRSEPSANSDIIGEIPFDAPLVEVNGISEDGKWSRVNAIEAVGWVRNRYLAPAIVELLQGTTLPVGLICQSEEPFDSIHISRADLLYDAYDVSQTELEIISVVQSGAAWPTTEIVASSDGRNLSLIIEEEVCQSSMTDNSYPYRSYFQEADDEKRYFGCCTLKE